MPSGVQSYAKRWELLEGAQRTIHLVTFSIINDDTSSRLADIVEIEGATGGGGHDDLRRRGPLHHTRLAGSSSACGPPASKSSAMTPRSST